MKVIASSIRGQRQYRIEREDGQLCVVLSAESFHPGKGTPTTQIDMPSPLRRREGDHDRFKTTEQVERAFVEDRNFSYLYSDADGHHFMNDETFEQMQVATDVIGDQEAMAAGGHEGHAVDLQRRRRRHPAAAAHHA